MASHLLGRGRMPQTWPAQDARGTSTCGARSGWRMSPHAGLASGAAPVPGELVTLGLRMSAHMHTAGPADGWQPGSAGPGSRLG